MKKPLHPSAADHEQQVSDALVHEAGNKPVISGTRHPKSELPTRFRAIFMVAAFAIIGTTAVLLTHAATLVSSFEAETATLTSGATSISDTTASGGKAIKFGAVSSTITPPPTTTQTTNCAPKPSACGYPDATNTGPVAGTVFKTVPTDISSGPGWSYDFTNQYVRVDGDGAVLDGLVLTDANIEVFANNVTIKNSKIMCQGECWAIGLRHTANVTVSHNELYSVATSGANRMAVGLKDIYGDSTGTQIIGNNIYHASTGVQIAEGTVKDNYIHDLIYYTGDHLNGTTTNGGSDAMLISHNTVFNPYLQTDAISLFEDFGAIANKTIDNNLVAGGGYCIYGGANPGGAATSNVKITNNRFARLYFSNCGSYGPVTAFDPAGAGNVWSGNVWDDTNAVVGY